VTTTTTLVDGLGFPEGPRWRDGALFFSDFRDRCVRAVTPDGVVTTVLELDEVPSGLGWTPDGDLLVVVMERRAVLRVHDGAPPQLHADLAAHAPARTNDMVVDDRGAAYVGNFGFELYGAERPTPTPTVLLRVDPDGAVSVAAEDLLFPNGMVLTPDGRTLVVAETYGRRLTAYDVSADGVLSGRRTWAGTPEGVFPDGICLDADGEIWVATARRPEVLRVREGGHVTGRVAVGSGNPAFACMLGGEDGRTLFVCTSSGSAPDQRDDGRIEVARVDVPRAGRP
jgi:sugar lactone lactonase YvrE